MFVTPILILMPHFTVSDTGTQRIRSTCPKPHRIVKSEAGLEPKPLNYKTDALDQPRFKFTLLKVK